jgi:hypothetical protein
VHDYSGVDRDGITSFAASEDLERVVKVIDRALQYANDKTYCLGTRRLDTAEDEGYRGRAATTRPRRNAQRSSPSRMTLSAPPTKERE